MQPNDTLLNNNNDSDASHETVVDSGEDDINDSDASHETVVDSGEDDINLSYQRLLELEEASEVQTAYCIMCKSQTSNFFCHAGCEDQYNAIHKTSEPVDDILNEHGKCVEEEEEVEDVEEDEEVEDDTCPMDECDNKKNVQNKKGRCNMCQKMWYESKRIFFGRERRCIKCQDIYFPDTRDKVEYVCNICEES